MAPLLVSRTLDLECSPEALWPLLGEAAELGSWLGGTLDLPIAPGAAGRFVDHDGSIRELRIDEVTESSRVRFTWWPEGADSLESSVTLALEPSTTGSRLIVTESLAEATLAERAETDRGAGADPDADPDADVATASAARTGASWEARLISLWLAVCASVPV